MINYREYKNRKIDKNCFRLMINNFISIFELKEKKNIN